VRDEQYLIADAPSPMTAWTGVLVAPLQRARDVDEALSQLQAELDAHGRAAQYEIEVESSGAGSSQTPAAVTADRQARVTAWVGLLAGVLSPIAALQSQWPTVKLIGALVFVLVGLGPGIMCWVDAGEPYAQAALSVAVSIAAFALVAVGMIWLTSWHPTWILLAAVASVASCLYRLLALHRRHSAALTPSAARSTA
jgi:hypothetical protein